MLQKAVMSQKAVTSRKAVMLQKAVMSQKMVTSQKAVPRTNNMMKPNEEKKMDVWCDAGMYSGMTITMYINYAHVAQQDFLLHFTKYMVN